MDLVAAAERIGAALLRPLAETVDVDGVPRSHLDALAAAGLLGIAAPTDAGGSDLTPAVARRVVETLAAADATTWFVWTQHHTPVRAVRRSSNTDLRSHLLPELAAGRLIAGVAYTHLRRPGAPALRAEPDGAGWRFTGDIAWLTSWNLADVFCIAAQHRDDVVWAVLPLAAGPTVEPQPLALAAMAGTHTVAVRLTGLRVPTESVAVVEPLAQWREQDAARTADVSPAVFGVTADALRRLAVLGEERADESMRALAGELGRRLDTLRAQADELADQAVTEPTEDLTHARLATRAAAHVLSVHATTALVAAGGGRSMSLDNAAQRLARTATFLLVQGQTGPVRSATLQVLASR
ncbi:MAG: acyl-CoA/acyl-ACP dehydrogenase [Frankiales bacterium]|nr:acyl-CoA/acyl-ACP dehydrogenase [Frankiales bacterium]